MTSTETTLPLTHSFGLDRARSQLRRITTAAQPGVLLALRLVFGYGLFRAGLGKLQHLDQVAGFFASLGLPAAQLNAALVAGFELVGGGLLLVGLATRVITLPLLVILSMAMLTAHRAELGVFITDPGTFISAAPVPFIAALVALLGFGPGKLSVDALLRRQGDRHSEPPAAA
ncbi:MAG: DoxX family protein [Deltaproteobacteria bacterium]|nr:DoxX family protein [Deltaproteobacteria bacterium]